MNGSPLPSRRQKKQSLSMIVATFRKSIERFPISSVMILLTTVWFIYYIECTNISDNVKIAMNFVLPMSCMLSLAVSVWCRAFSLSRPKENIAQMPGNSILLIPEYINIPISDSDGEENVDYCYISGYIFKK